MQETPIVEARGLTKRYGSTVAVDGIDFAIFRSETFGMLGPNGAGKTSTMKMLSCVSPVSGGQLLVDGLDVASESRRVRDRIGVVAQQDSLDPDLSVRENLIVYARYYGIRGARAEARVQEMLEFFRLASRADSEVDELSGGMKRRLTLARAFLSDPVLVVLDEPTTGLDPQSRHTVWEQLAALKSRGVSVVMSTHYMDEAAMLCDRLVIMDHGRILAEGTPEELVHRYAGAETAMIRPHPSERDRVASLLRDEGLVYRDRGAVITVSGDDGRAPKLPTLPDVAITYRPSDLEDVFLNLTGRDLREE